ncbi:MAG: hypothetical protein V1780_00460 [Chloroflexota bacterium]
MAGSWREDLAGSQPFRRQWLAAAIVLVMVAGAVATVRLMPAPPGPLPPAPPANPPAAT